MRIAEGVRTLAGEKDAISLCKVHGLDMDIGILTATSVVQDPHEVSKRG